MAIDLVANPDFSGHKHNRFAVISSCNDIDNITMAAVLRVKRHHSDLPAEALYSVHVNKKSRSNSNSDVATSVSNSYADDEEESRFRFLGTVSDARAPILSERVHQMLADAAEPTTAKDTSEPTTEPIAEQCRPREYRLAKRFHKLVSDVEMEQVHEELVALKFDEQQQQQQVGDDESGGGHVEKRAKHVYIGELEDWDQPIEQPPISAPAVEQEPTTDDVSASPLDVPTPTTLSATSDESGESQESFVYDLYVKELPNEPNQELDALASQRFVAPDAHPQLTSNENSTEVVSDAPVVEQATTTSGSEVTNEPESDEMIVDDDEIELIAEDTDDFEGYSAYPIHDLDPHESASIEAEEAFSSLVDRLVNLVHTDSPPIRRWPALAGNSWQYDAEGSDGEGADSEFDSDDEEEYDDDGIWDDYIEPYYGHF